MLIPLPNNFFVAPPTYEPDAHTGGAVMLAQTMPKAAPKTENGLSRLLRQLLEGHSSR